MISVDLSGFMSVNGLPDVSTLFTTDKIITNLTHASDTTVPAALTIKNYIDLGLSDKANSIDIPSAVSQLTNDSNFISGYTETDPIYLTDKPNIALKTESIFNKDSINLNVSSFNLNGIETLSDDSVISSKVFYISNDLISMATHFEQKYNSFSISKTQGIQCNVATKFLLNSTAVEDLEINSTGSNIILFSTVGIQLNSYTDNGILFNTRGSVINIVDGQIKINGSGFNTSGGLPTINTSGKIDSSLFSVDYNTLSNKPSIPSAISQLTNDSSFLTSFIETDPVYIADKPNIALKSEVTSGLALKVNQTVIDELLVPIQPISLLPELDTTYDVYVHYLNDVTDTIEYSGLYNKIRKMTLDIVSNNPLISGNIAIVPILNNMENAAIIIPVLSAISTVEFVLSANYSTISIKRDYNNVLDTLKENTTIVGATIFDETMWRLR
jgi:hypothetical protein